MNKNNCDERGRLWGGRFSCGPADCLESLNRSLEVDKRLYKQDIKGSIAYAIALQEANIITQEELNLLIDGLNQVT